MRGVSKLESIERISVARASKLVAPFVTNLLISWFRESTGDVSKGGECQSYRSPLPGGYNVFDVKQLLKLPHEMYRDVLTAITT